MRSFLVRLISDESLSRWFLLVKGKSPIEFCYNRFQIPLERLTCEEKPRSTLSTCYAPLMVTIAFGCNLLLLRPGLPPFEPTLTSTPGKVFPTEIVPTKNPPTNAPEPTATSLSGVTITSENQYYQVKGNTAERITRATRQAWSHVIKRLAKFLMPMLIGKSSGIFIINKATMIAKSTMPRFR